MDTLKHHRFLVPFNFGLVYLFWGSTYLAIHVVVNEQIPPLMMGGVRFSVAGGVMLVVCALLGKKVMVSPKIILRLGVIGVLLLTTGNVVLGWAEQYLPSGFAALLLATVPLWIALIETFILKGERLTRLGLMGLIMGLVGLGILMWPKLQMRADMPSIFWLASGMLLLAALSWAVGSIFSRRWNLQIDPLCATGWQMLISGCVNGVLAIAAFDHHRVVWTTNGVWAMVYLIIAGSWIGYTAYVWLLKHVPTAKVATFAYVNPIVAVFLGWLFLQETVDGYVYAGATVIVASVWLVNKSKVTPPPTKDTVE